LSTDPISVRWKVLPAGPCLAIAAFLVFQGCAARMPSVSEFMVPGIRSTNFGATRSFGTRDTSKYEAWRYGCTGMKDPVGSAAGLAECREWYEDGFRSSDSAATVELEGSFYAGDKFRLGLFFGTYSAVELVGGYRGDYLGAMTWYGFAGGGWGGAVVQHAKPSERVSFGLYEYFADNKFGPTLHDKTEMHRQKIIGYYEVGVGSWVHVGNVAGPSLEWRMGRELSSGRWRYQIGVNVNITCPGKDWYKCGEDPRQRSY